MIEISACNCDVVVDICLYLFTNIENPDIPLNNEILFFVIYSFISLLISSI